MYIIIWQYTVHPNQLAPFIDNYHSGGEWVKLFQQSTDYVGTDFLQSEESKYTFITVDKWLSRKSYEQFLKEHEREYKELDIRCAEFTSEERLIGKHFLFE